MKISNVIVEINVYYLTPDKSAEDKLKKGNFKYIGPLVIYKMVDSHNYLLMTLGGKILRGLFECERLKPATLRTSHGNVCITGIKYRIGSIEMKIL